MADGKLVTSLRDVELQLQRAALAVKLHLEMLQKDSQQTVVQSRETKAQVMALSTNIDAMQSELNSGTTEILALITKSLAVGATEMDPSGEETETEDEMELDGSN
ncbi:hypothetical protein PR003_g5210 [Phytophthora rubi]|uniref:Uncharacterized protein n=1 Tax=Phytophthora rubi TaxID=129364 RepID=A0A6A3N843_9STRA|nr:hypothetical protein PR002_g8994 [Phytophthora rubi]KAE9037818.1 hypothetical protein PR001_g8218 [Phytophthora rubi]KAE9350766.1 hypothetical protein PR003_g5210 [Phytophthora rubi]